jgi:hypothetical protein
MSVREYVRLSNYHLFAVQSAFHYGTHLCDALCGIPNKLCKYNDHYLLKETLNQKPNNLSSSSGIKFKFASTLKLRFKKFKIRYENLQLCVQVQYFFLRKNARGKLGTSA